MKKLQLRNNESYRIGLKLLKDIVQLYSHFVNSQKISYLGIYYNYFLFIYQLKMELFTPKTFSFEIENVFRLVINIS